MVTIIVPPHRSTEVEFRDVLELLKIEIQFLP